MTARPLPEAEQTEEEKAWVKGNLAYRAAELDYFNEQSHKPQTVAFALHDNPIGAAVWILEKFKTWSDSGDNIESAFTKDQLVTNIMWYLVTDSAGSGVWIYSGNLIEPPPPRPARIIVPTGVAQFPRQMVSFITPRRFLERDFNLVHYSAMPRGGHFGCFEQPQLFVEDVRKFFRVLRG